MNLEFLDSVSFLLFTCILYFLSVLSKRFGEVMGMRKYYNIYYIGMFFTFSGSVIMILPLGERDANNLYGYVFFSIGLTLGLMASIKYWGWLIKEILKRKTP
jgi:hypothetical protein